MTGFAEDGRRIDHASEARRNIDGLHDYQSEAGMTEASMLTVAIEAQAHATLALVEQQRIANLIAWTVGSGYSAAPEIAAEIVAALHIPITEGPY